MGKARSIAGQQALQRPLVTQKLGDSSRISAAKQSQVGSCGGELGGSNIIAELIIDKPKGK